MPIQPILPVLKNGARFYKCALQVNPYAYLLRHGKQGAWTDEVTYNTSLVAALVAEGIEVISITDHFRVSESTSLAAAAQTAFIRVLPGFEAKSQEGVHILCIFNEGTPQLELERIIGSCGITDSQQESPNGNLPCAELIEKCQTEWRGIAIAAHVQSSGGLLATLRGQARAKVWKCPHLLAASIPGEVSAVNQGYRVILDNSDPVHQRDRPIALINAQDISDPPEVSSRGAWSWIKMSAIGVEGLRQAFLDPESRIRLASDPTPIDHAELLAISWTGGFLDGQTIRFNENLNVIIGGRGAGKSTVIESIRACLGAETRGEDAKKTHDGMVKEVLQSGTKISLWVRTRHPSDSVYCIERVLPNPSTVVGADGALLSLKPSDLLSGIDIFGQHEIAQIARSPERRTKLLSRFIAPARDSKERRIELLTALAQNREELVRLRDELTDKEGTLATLPNIRDTLKRHAASGLEERLKERNLVLSEERIVKSITDTLLYVRSGIDALKQASIIDRTSLASKSLDPLPHKSTLVEFDGILEKLDTSLNAVIVEAERLVSVADTDVAAVQAKWQKQREAVDGRYQQILRDLQKEQIDGDAFIKLRRQLGNLEPLEGILAKLKAQIDEVELKREGLLSQWTDIKGSELRLLMEAARTVGAKLSGKLKVSVKPDAQRSALGELIKEKLSGRLSEAIDVLMGDATLSVIELAKTIRTGADELVSRYGFSKVQAQRISQLDESSRLRLMELEFGHLTTIELNIANDGQPNRWVPMDKLSMGQKATAVLLLVLLDSKAPIIIDQPEDDLDNRFLTDGIVPRIKEEKRRCQFIFTTHNANIPVLGDAELIIGITPEGDDRAPHAIIKPEHRGSIDDPEVKDLVKGLLEGGRVAFETRRAKYGF